MAWDADDVAVRQIERNPGPTFWTEVEMVTRLPLTMDLRPRRLGDAPGLLLGDKAFDARYFLEAAPEAAARLLFDDAVRAGLLAAELWIVHRERGFMLVREGWLPPAQVASLVALARLLAAGMPRALDAVERAVPRSGAPYRPGVAPEALMAVKSQRDGELRALARARDRDVNLTMLRYMARAIRVPVGIVLLLFMATGGHC